MDGRHPAGLRGSLVWIDVLVTTWAPL